MEKERRKEERGFLTCVCKTKEKKTCVCVYPIDTFNVRKGLFPWEIGCNITAASLRVGLNFSFHAKTSKQLIIDTEYTYSGK